MAGGGTIASATPTIGPSPTPTIAVTAVVPPLEPLTVPDGFGVSVFAEGLGPVWSMVVAENGDVLASVPDRNAILMLPDRDHNGVADGVTTFALENGLNQPYAMALRPGWLYVANTDRVARYPYKVGDLQAEGAPESLVDLPAVGGQSARSLAFGPDGRMYAGVGASCDVCAEDDPRRAAVLQLNAEGRDPKQYSSGLHAPLGLAFHPATGDLWATEVGRVGLGDDRPPDELNRLVPGHFGWPMCYGNQVFDGQSGGDPLVCGGTLAPAITFRAHSVPLGLAFYGGTQFPAPYRGNLFVALHGSGSRRTIPTGYNVVRIPFSGGMPEGDVFDFVSGWLRPDTRRWGSPVDLDVTPDGSLLVSDDGGGRIYRVFYTGPREGG